jgi:phenylalanyl-tRNA synthetase alpha chain
MSHDMVDLAKDQMLQWSDTQYRRLKELGAARAFLDQSFAAGSERDQAYQILEKQLVKVEKGRLADLLAQGGKTQLELLCETVSEQLIAEGFVKVATPTVISAAALEKMTITRDHPLYKQVYWLNSKQCLRPMLAPNLYSLMQDLSRQKSRPIRFFEIGSCFRKETDGANHTSEFTMLNLVEMGLPVQKREARLLELGSLVVKSVGLKSFCFESEQSEVYGTTLDLVSGVNSVEVGSGAMGPHPLDAEWGVRESWVGFGIGMERLLMLVKKDSTISRWCKSITYMDGIRLKI